MVCHRLVTLAARQWTDGATSAAMAGSVADSPLRTINRRRGGVEMAAEGQRGGRRQTDDGARPWCGSKGIQRTDVRYEGEALRPGRWSRIPVRSDPIEQSGEHGAAFVRPNAAEMPSMSDDPGRTKLYVQDGQRARGERSASRPRQKGRSFEARTGRTKVDSGRPALCRRRNTFLAQSMSAAVRRTDRFLRRAVLGQLAQRAEGDDICPPGLITASNVRCKFSTWSWVAGASRR